MHRGFDGKRNFLTGFDPDTQFYGCLGGGVEGTVGTGLVRITSTGVNSGEFLNIKTTLARNAKRMMIARIEEAAVARGVSRRCCSNVTAISCTVNIQPGQKHSSSVSRCTSWLLGVAAEKKPGSKA